MLRRPRLAGFCVLLIALPAAAEKHVSPDAIDPSSPTGQGGEITIELDTARGRNADRSLALALIGSAVLPGVGEAYLGETRTAKSFLLAEAGFWAGFFISLQARESYLQSARNYASEYAGADAGGQGPGYLERLATYRSYHEKEHRQDSYELAQVLSGKDVAEMPDWDFGSANTPENTDHWRDYQSIMRHYRGAKVAMSFAVGAMALNRAASVAHTLRVYRRTSGKGLTVVSPPPFRFDPEFAADGGGMRLTVNF
ncbi:MAG TPA: hypothetical protein VHO02_00850 [Fibrobacteria bacterium]|jgi:hypothetical protein|nr:hypothetical protein [Fibrobacteria bacterium]